MLKFTLASITPLIAMMLTISMLVTYDNTPETPKNPTFAEYTLNIDNLNPDTKKQVRCLATNIYFESRGQSIEGQKAVGLVTMNRVTTQGFPSSVCDVVKQRNSRTCQFSWWCDARLRARALAHRFIPSDQPLFEEIQRLAGWIYFHHNEIEDTTHGATFYHATYVQPRWKNVEKTIRIEDHIFYRSK